MAVVLLNLSDQSVETLQRQLVLQVRAMILGGDLPTGSELPSIRSLAGEQRVSVVTVQRAYEVLEREGLIQARRGRGYYVQSLSEGQRRELALAQLDARLAPLLEQAQAEGLDPSQIMRRVEAILKGVPS